jgi:uncharacterized protein
MKKWLLSTVLLWQVAAYAQQAVNTMPAQEIYQEAINYFYGVGGKTLDAIKAAQFFKQAANQGNGKAATKLGFMYETGQGVKLNLDSALSFYKQAAKLKDGNAYLELARIYQEDKLLPQNFELAAQYSKDGMALGNTVCQNKLAYFYFKGLGVQQSYTKAFALYKPLVDKWDVNAMYFLGLCYRNGYGVKANEAEAIKWLQKAASYNDYQAKHELAVELTPENSTIISPQLQQQVQALKKYEEKFTSASTNDISGSYTGYAVYYDCSKTFVHEIVPLALSLQQNNGIYTGIWTEGDTLDAPIKAQFNGNALSFDSSSQYSRCNYYSYRDVEKYQFKSAQLGIKFMKDSVYLSGDVRFYSLGRHEPGQPMYIVLAKSIDALGLNQQPLALRLSPNPATTIVKTTFTLAKAGKIKIQIASADGKSMQTKIEETLLPAGTYTYPIAVQNLLAGSYLLRISTGDGVNQSKKFIKL